jgi:phage terminase large subunit-like protein
MQMLREMWIDVEELPQTQTNLSTATQTLYDHLINRQLRIYPNAELRQHILNAATKESERHFRLTKEHQKRKIDACVALSFAILGAIRHGRPTDVDSRNFQPPTVDSSFDPFGWGSAEGD